MANDNNDDVHASIYIDYPGTQIIKRLTVTGDETNAVKVNRLMEALSKKINIMVQSEQGTKE